ncbi:MAG TPA: NADH-quinone oxidoreductase subunit J [Anaerolineales bacterium]|nr:NADH-quinone oxidoreductase subunit J [Anaerolineales bacterium]
MTGELLLFIVLGLVAIASAIGMLTSKNAVYAALYLVLNFASVAVFYLMLGSPFIALAQITVYGGAIMILFLFVIMLLGAEAIKAELTWSKISAPILLAVVLLIQAFLVVVNKTGGAQLAANTSVEAASPNPLAESLFTTYLLPFEITSILLLVAMVGAIVLTKKEKKGAVK